MESIHNKLSGLKLNIRVSILLKDFDRKTVGRQMQIVENGVLLFFGCQIGCFVFRKQFYSIKSSVPHKEAVDIEI